MNSLSQKLWLLAVAFIAINVSSKAQKLELSAGLNGGASNMTGSLAHSSGFYYTYRYGDDQYRTPYLYGHKLAYSYGVNFQSQLIYTSGLIFGANTGYELLRSKVDITQFIDYSGLAYTNTFPTLTIDPSQSNAKGNAILNNYFINLNPYLGYRVKMRHINIDLTAGTEFGFALSSSQKIKVISPDQFSITKVITKPPTDIRIRAGVALSYRRFGLNANYARGLKSYVEDNQYLQDAPHGKVFSQVIRAGISYRIN